MFANVKANLKSEQIADMKIDFVKSMEEVVELALDKWSWLRAGVASDPRGCLGVDWEMTTGFEMGSPNLSGTVTPFNVGVWKKSPSA
jgi:hypothetical protein